MDGFTGPCLSLLYFLLSHSITVQPKPTCDMVVALLYSKTKMAAISNNSRTQAIADARENPD